MLHFAARWLCQPIATDAVQSLRLCIYYVLTELRAASQEHRIKQARYQAAACREGIVAQCGAVELSVARMLPNAVLPATPYTHTYLKKHS